MDSVFFDTYVWPALIVTAHSLAIIFALLVSLAFFMLADRKIWAAAQLRKGPTMDDGPTGTENGRQGPTESFRTLCRSLSALVDSKTGQKAPGWGKKRPAETCHKDTSRQLA